MFYSCAFPLHQVADTTGAGDTFLGGLVGWVARSGGASPESIKQGIQVGTCLASFTVESFGVERLCSAGQADLEERVSVLNTLSRVADIVF